MSLISSGWNIWLMISSIPLYRIHLLIHNNSTKGNIIVGIGLTEHVEKHLFSVAEIITHHLHQRKESLDKGLGNLRRLHEVTLWLLPGYTQVTLRNQLSVGLYHRVAVNAQLFSQPPALREVYNPKPVLSRR